MTPSHAVADEIQGFRDSYTVSMLNLMVATLGNRDDVLRSMGMDQGSVTALRRKDGTQWKGEVWPAVHRMGGGGEHNISFMIALFTAGIVSIDDALGGSQVAKTAEMRFLHQLRNGVSHGNVFEIRKPLAKPATFEAFEITLALHGTLVLFDYIDPGDVMALLETIETQLRASP